MGLEQTGLHRLQGVFHVNVVKGNREMLMAGDVLEFCCTAASMKALRTLSGLRLKKQRNLDSLGADRRARCLYEVAAEPDSESRCC